MAKQNPPSGADLTPMQIAVLTLVDVSEMLKTTLSPILALANITQQDAETALTFLTRQTLARDTGADTYKSLAERTEIRLKQTKSVKDGQATFLDCFGGCTMTLDRKATIREFSQAIKARVAQALEEQKAAEPEEEATPQWVAHLRPPAGLGTRHQTEESSVGPGQSPGAAPSLGHPPVPSGLMEGCTAQEVVDLLVPRRSKIAAGMDRFQYLRGYFDDWTHASNTADEIARTVKERREAEVAKYGPILKGMEALQHPFPAP